MNLEEICHGAVVAARRAGAFIGEERKKFEHSKVIEKGQRDLVSYVDLTAEKMIVSDLKKILPEAGFLTEEKTVDEGKYESCDGSLIRSMVPQILFTGYLFTP
jgi:myo-inositol-1(or 4)-monophosphatase